jgi:uncharacterized protein DUF4249
MKKYIAIFIATVLFASCEDVIDVEIKDEDQGLYAVEARITTEDEPTVFLYKAIPVTEDVDYEGISDAVVTISDNAMPSNEIILVEDDERNGFYVVSETEDYLGQAGRIYTLTIVTPEGTTITSSEELNPVEPIDSIQIHPSERGNGYFLAIYIFSQETEGEGDFYKWDVYNNDTLINDAMYMAFASDDLVDGNYVNSLEIFTDFHDPNEESERMLGFMDTIYVKQTSISEYAYDFYYQMVNQTSTGFLFSVPPANLPSSFSSSDGKDVVGIFTASDVSTSNTIIIDESIESLLRKP